MPPAKRSAAGAVAPKTKKAKTADPSPSTEAPAAVATSTASSSGMIDSRVSEAQAKKAFEALVSHTKRRLASGSAKHDLLAAGDDEEEGADGLKLNGDISEKGEAVWLMVTVKQLNNRKLVKPVRVPLEHTLYPAKSTASVCLLTKDPQREYKDLLVELGIKSISRVVGVSKLKGKFKPFDVRRQLLQDHDVFLADDRITTLLPALLGKKFFDSKKQPILVDISKKKNVKENIEKALSGTYYLQNTGSNTAIKLGHLRTHTTSQLLDNLRTALPHIIARVPENWTNVQALEIKTGTSASLPIWNCNIGVGVGDEGAEQGRWANGVVREDDLEMEVQFGDRVNGKKGSAVDDGEAEKPGKSKKADAAPPAKKKAASKKTSAATTGTGLADTNKKARSSATKAAPEKAKKSSAAGKKAKA